MTREEAIKEIKMWGIEAPRQRAVLETLIPELRESEDERIRKRIYGLIYHNDALLDKDKLLAYLEKQKEQKPAEWSHDDIQHRNKILLDLHNMQSQYKIDKKKNWKDADFYDVCMKDNGENIEWLENLPERFNLQPKQEWSEEDEKHIDICIKALKEWEMQDSEDFSTTISFLKSLRPSWKPSEEQMEVDLKEETKEWVNLMVGASFPEQDGDFISEEDYRSVIRQTALHFYELGKNSKK